MLIAWIGSLLFLSLDLIIVNRFLGAEAGGNYGLALQWATLLHTLAATIASPLTPIALAQFAKGNHEGMSRLFLQAVKLLAVVLALPVGLIWGLALPLLTVWLGPGFEELAPLMNVLTFHLSMNLAVLPIVSIFVTLNKVRWHGLSSLVLGVVNLLLAILWVQWDERGLGVALAGAVALTLKNGLFVPLYGSRLLNLRWSAFLPGMLSGLLGAGAVAALGYLISSAWMPGNWLELGGIAALITAIYGVVAYFYILNPEDRKLARRFIPSRLSGAGRAGGYG
jgi:membrane protein EpsK